jgi:mannose-6-phosphate isomerase-like protein (cupin superfamily)
MHVHRRATEFYYILSGTGVIRVGDERIHAEPESLVIIPPGTVHQVIPENAPFKVLVFCAPAWQEDDEILAE